MKQTLAQSYESPGYPLGIRPPSQDFTIIRTPWGERRVTGKMLTAPVIFEYPPDMTDEQITLGS